MLSVTLTTIAIVLAAATVRPLRDKDAKARTAMVPQLARQRGVPRR